MQSVTSRACEKFLEEVQSITSRACWTLPEEVQSVTSRACQKLLGKSAERNIKSVLGKSMFHALST